MFPKARKDVVQARVQVRRLAPVIAPQGAGRDDNGHVVRGEVRDEPRGAW